MTATALIATKLIDVYWLFYWQGDLELAEKTKELMIAAGIDCNGRLNKAPNAVNE